MNNGKSLEWISNQFAKSGEFKQTYGPLTDAEFVDVLCHHTMTQEPELNYADESAEWIARLEAGWSRGKVMLGFSESPELIHRTGTVP